MPDKALGTHPLPLAATDYKQQSWPGDYPDDPPAPSTTKRATPERPACMQERRNNAGSQERDSDFQAQHMDNLRQVCEREASRRRGLYMLEPGRHATRFCFKTAAASGKLMQGAASAAGLSPNIFAIPVNLLVKIVNQATSTSGESCVGELGRLAYVSRTFLEIVNEVARALLSSERYAVQGWVGQSAATGPLQRLWVAQTRTMKNSYVLKNDHGELAPYLLRWLLAAGVAPAQLLYRGSRDGWRPTDFHQTCNDKGCTVVLVKSEKGNIFGGYADSPWKSDGALIASPRGSAFLFSLRCPSDEAPMKFLLLGTGQPAQHNASVVAATGNQTQAAETNEIAQWHRAMLGDPNTGPRFGHCELVIGGGNVGTAHMPLLAAHRPFNEVKSCCSVQRCGVYACDTRSGIGGDIYLDGGPEFIVAEIEVYRVDGVVASAQTVGEGGQTNPSGSDYLF